MHYGAMTCVRLRYANRTYRAAFDVAFELAFDFAFESNSHVALPIVRGGKWIRSEACLSAASLLHFPFYDLHNWVSRRDSDFELTP
ncbi:hypothetical protein [Undibacterium parvum]|uniref:Uncharacterized protein n=1 Tax=Undibacterium parvum TaxID=401471 RepID=A0A3Q9BS76_9BURK|nr:hypothetical protein [Undibacterium parvum]AZP13319.1 hypothetical protein EJN92_15750 [Undibacterium parvum]